MVQLTENVQKKIAKISIEGNLSLLEGMQKMDENYVKLLLVFKEGKYAGLLSIGDIQRYFIKHQSFDSKIQEAMRSDFRVAHKSDSVDDIRKIMVEFRTEFMPVLDDTATLLDVVFWEDVFKEKQVIGQKNLELPVVIMAGGKGTRLKPITNIIPKPLIPIGEKPIAEVIIDRFVKMGSKDFYMSINYKAKMIESYFNEITDKEYSVNYFYETKPLGTAGSLHLLKDKIKSTFFVSNCDIIVDQDYKEMYDYHCTNNNELTLIAVVKHLEIPYGTIKVKENGLLESIHEKPKYTFLVNAGVYILEPQLLAEIPKDEFFHITDLIEKIKERKGRIGVFPVNEAAWMDIGQWKNYQETLKRFDSAINL